MHRLELPQAQLELLFVASQAALLMGDFDQARTILRGLEVLLPHHSVPPADLARVELKAGRVDEAFQHLCRATEKHPSSPYVAQGWVEYHCEMRDDNRAFLALADVRRFSTPDEDPTMSCFMRAVEAIRERGLTLKEDLCRT